MRLNGWKKGATNEEMKKKRFLYDRVCERFFFFPFLFFPFAQAAVVRGVAHLPWPRARQDEDEASGENKKTIKAKVQLRRK